MAGYCELLVLFVFYFFNIYLFYLVFKWLYLVYTFEMFIFSLYIISVCANIYMHILYIYFNIRCIKIIKWIFVNIFNLVFQQNISAIRLMVLNCVYLHSTGFLYYTSIPTTSIILLGLPNAPWNLFPDY